MVTSIPYDENFEIRVDGKKVPYGKANTAFLGFLIGKGEHEVEIIYHAPGAEAGKLLSLSGVLLYLVGILRKRKYCSQKKF